MRFFPGLMFIVAMTSACRTNDGGSAVKDAATPSPTSGCVNFSGTYQGSCTGLEVGTGGPTDSLTVSQTACSTLQMLDATLTIDGKNHSSEGFQYLSSWDANLYPKNDHLRTEIKTETAGVVVLIRYSMAKTPSGILIERKSTRSVPALNSKEEVLETCTFK